MSNELKQKIGICGTWLVWVFLFLNQNPILSIVQFQKAILQKVGSIVIAYSSRIQLSKGVKLPS